ncbi:MAG: hypothetical protein GY832_30000 [Chloroflexi bacterium]|nr:hypothetical protein [Chloroflexota bacterium]
MLHKTKRLLPFSIALLWLLAGCTSNSLPELAKGKLDEHIARLDSSTPSYEVVSVQKASGTPDEELVVNPIPETHDPGVCPPSYSGSETWCVVIDQSITGTDGRTFSHFLIIKQGRFWDVENLTDSERDAFLYVGCDNWDIVEKD